MNKSFKSGVTWWFIITVYGLLLSVGVFAALKENHWAPILLIVAVLSFLSWTFFGTSYVITNDQLLIVKSGPFRYKVTLVKNITKIQKPSGPTIQAAPSLDRIEVCYNKYDSILISPKDKRGFVEVVKTINPAVEILL